MNNNILKSALKKYDENKEFMIDKLKNIKYYKLIFNTGDSQKNIVIFLDENKKEIYKYKQPNHFSHYGAPAVAFFRCKK
jgi:hypothetical protein